MGVPPRMKWDVVLESKYRCSEACLVELQKDLLLPLPVNQEVSLLSENAHDYRGKAAFKLWCQLPQ